MDGSTTQMKITTIYETDKGILNCVTEDDPKTVTEFLKMTDRHLEKEGAIERKIEDNLIKL